MRHLSARTGIPPRDDFRRFVAALPASTFRLALTHVTDGYVLRNVLESGSLWSNEPCPILGQPLIYAFYGRAAYRPRQDGQTSCLSFVAPAVLILDPSVAPNPTHVFGFDSGAFMRGYMDEYIHPSMPLFDFLLEPDIHSAADLAAAVFRNAESYLKNVPDPAFQVPAGNLEAVSYRKIISAISDGHGNLDDRACTPELIFGQPLSFADCVRAVILPDELEADPDVGGRIKALGIPVEPYEWIGGGRPLEYHMLIRRLAKPFVVL